MKNKLVIIDAGHTRTKYSIYNHHKKFLHICLLNRPFSWPESIRLNKEDEVLLIGTNQRMNERILSHLTSVKTTCHVSTLGKDCRVPIKSDTAKTTGVDRLANAYGAKLNFPGKSCLIISAGSALVIDYLHHDGTFKGGLISLGFSNYKEAMQEINPMLIFDSNEKQSANYPAKNTSDAVFQGWLEMVVNTIQKLSTTHECDEIIVTGGDAELISKHLNLKNHVLPYLAADAMAEAFGYFTLK